MVGFSKQVEFCTVSCMRIGSLLKPLPREKQNSISKTYCDYTYSRQKENNVLSLEIYNTSIWKPNNFIYATRIFIIVNENVTRTV